MILEIVDRAMQGLQAAFAAGRLYAADHPALGAAVERVTAALAEAHADREEIEVLILDRRVVCDDVPLPSSPRLMDGLFAILRAQGIELLGFARGVSNDELRAFLQQALQAVDQPKSLVASAKIRLAFVEGLSRPAGRIGPETAAVVAGTSFEAIERSWSALHDPANDKPRLPVEMLGGLVAQISSVAGISRGCLLPLAMLKRHDEYTFVHTYNVAVMSTALGAAAGIPIDMLQDLAMAAMLHDVGKQLTPIEVLNKRGSLTDADQQIMRRHPVDGANLLMNARDVPAIAAIVAYEHHMNIDGSGYPNQPKGWKVNLASQIVHVADVFDALRTNRPYRQAMSLDEAMGILRNGSGKWFDSELFKLFEQRVVHRLDLADATHQPVQAASAVANPIRSAA